MIEHEITLKESGKITRLTNKTFNFDSRIKEGFFCANYFIKASKIISENIPQNIVTMQFFQRTPNVMVCGLDEVIALIHTFAINPNELIIEALNDGDIVQANEPVLKITGKYQNFGYLESVIDGILARRTSVATNTHKVIMAANGKDVFSMADRQDDYLTQIGDGYASYVAGIRKVSTNAQGLWWNGKGMGTMPHALIQVCGGDILKAAKLYKKTFPNEKITALVDYNNNVIEDSIRLATELKEQLNAVRVDTSKALIDRYFDDKDISSFDARGVCKELIIALRKELNKRKFNHVKIIVSSSFNDSKIREWTSNNVPVDMYGVGSFFVNNSTVGFTGDLVKLNGRHQAKVGRNNIENARLQVVKYPIY